MSDAPDVSAGNNGTDPLPPSPLGEMPLDLARMADESAVALAEPSDAILRGPSAELDAPLRGPSAKLDAPLRGPSSALHPTLPAGPKRARKPKSPHSDIFVEWFGPELRDRIVRVTVQLVQPGGNKVRLEDLAGPVTFQEFLQIYPDDGVYALYAYDSTPRLVRRVERLQVRHSPGADRPARTAAPTEAIERLMRLQEQRHTADAERARTDAERARTELEALRDEIRSLRTTAPVAAAPEASTDAWMRQLLTSVLTGESRIAGGGGALTADQALNAQGKGFDAGKDLGEQTGYAKGYADGQEAARSELADRFDRLNALAQQLAGEKREIATNREDFYREQRQVLTRQPEPAHVPMYPQPGSETGPDPFVDLGQQPAGDWDPEIEAILSGQAIPEPDDGFEDQELDLDQEPELDLDDGDEQLDVDDEEQDDEQGGDDEPEIQDHPPEDVPVWGDDDPPDDAD